MIYACSIKTFVRHWLTECDAVDRRCVSFADLLFGVVTFSEEERELDLNLPSVSEALPATLEPTELVINIDAEGRFFIDGAFRQAEEVEQILRRSQANNPLTQSVVIRGDRQSNWESVATAMNICKKVGIFEYTATMDDP